MLQPGPDSNPSTPKSVGAGTCFSQFAKAQRIVSLCQSYAALVSHQRSVKKQRSLDSKRAVKKNLPRRGDQQVGSANHLRDSHHRIIRDYGELIGGNIIVTPDDEVAEILSGRELLRAEVAIVEADDFAVRNLEAPIEWECWKRDT